MKATKVQPTEAKEFERELTGKETAKCFGMLAVMFLLASIDESIEWGVIEWVRMALALVVGFGTCVWQWNKMHTPLEEESHGE